MDFRKGAEGLAALARQEIRADPFGGTIFVFRAKRSDRIKLIFWDGADQRLTSQRRGPVNNAYHENGHLSEKAPQH